MSVFYSGWETVCLLSVTTMPLSKKRLSSRGTAFPLGAFFPICGSCLERKGGRGDALTIIVIAAPPSAVSVGASRFCSSPLPPIALHVMTTVTSPSPSDLSDPPSDHGDPPPSDHGDFLPPPLLITVTFSPTEDKSGGVTVAQGSCRGQLSCPAFLLPGSWNA